MTMAVGHQVVERLEPDGLRIKKQRSMKFTLHTTKPPPLKPPSSEPSSAVSELPPKLPPLSLPVRETASPELYRNYGIAQRPSTSHHPEPSRNLSSAIPTSPYSNERPSTSSRVRTLRHGYRSPSAERGSTPEPTTGENVNFSRPRQPSIRRQNPPPASSNNTSIPPLETRETKHPPEAEAARDRGYSTSSSRSIAVQPPAALRPSASIPEFSTTNATLARPRHMHDSGYRSLRGLSRPDSNYSTSRREPLPRPVGYDNEQVRTSFRSALTASSSFVGTSVTERSSVMTKSSSATSIYGKDEGLSVDDAIEMYEAGFQDTGPEDNLDSRPATADSQRKRISRLLEAMNEELPLPERMPEVKGLVTIVGPKVDPGSTHRFNGSLDLQEQYFKSPIPPRSLARAPTVEYGSSRDRYGFQKKSQHVTLEQYDAWNAPYQQHLTRRRKKWIALMRESGLTADNPVQFPQQTTKVKRFIRKGIPPEWRGNAWFFYAGGPILLARHHGLYEKLVQRAANGSVSETDNEIIERDLNRTFPDNIKFKPDPPGGADQDTQFSQETIPQPETPILKSLRRVLQTFAIHNPRIGYCQSLNFLAGLLLLFMNEEKSFWMLNMITSKYLPGTHEVSLEGANVDLGVLMTSIKETMPGIWSKVGGDLDGSAGDNKVSMRLPPITLCTTAWFMSCFIGTLPIETTLRVWDCFFYEGSKTLFRIALAIFKVGEQEIKSVNDPMEIFQVVQTIPRRLIDANALLEACFRRRNGFGHLSQDTIDVRRAERRAGYAEERARANGEFVPRKKPTFLRIRSRGKTETDA